MMKAKIQNKKIEFPNFEEMSYSEILAYIEREVKRRFFASFRTNQES